MPPTAPLVAAEGIMKRYGPTVALNDVSLTVEVGRSHALVGRNGAGKSTLVSIITGLQAADAGTLQFGGVPAPDPVDREAWRNHVACVYQKSTIIPEITVAENLFVNAQQGRWGFINWKALHNRADELLGEWGLDVDPTALAGSLSVEERQLVEIARSLSFGARFIILDEPTAQLDKAAIERLFGKMRELQDAGVTFLYISHHLQEIYEVCKDVTVYRDARHILTAPVEEVGRGDLIDAMTGETGGLSVADASTRPPLPESAQTMLLVDGLESTKFSGIDLTVRAGEVVGLAGISGSGKVELAEAVAGLHRFTDGSITVDGNSVNSEDVPHALAVGVGCVPRDRHHEGFVPDLSIADNVTMTIERDLGPLGFVSPARRTQLGASSISEYGIVTSGPDQEVSGLSGGNQQKVVMARALASDPKVLVLINPTAGVDVKSKEALLEVVESVREAGKAVMIVSDELEDLRPCDRVVVMRYGRIEAEHVAGWSDTELVASIEGMEL